MTDTGLPPEEELKPDSLIGLSRAMALLGTSRDRVKKMVADGALKTVQVGQQAQVVLRDVQSLVRHTLGSSKAGDADILGTGATKAADLAGLRFALDDITDAFASIASRETLTLDPLGPREEWPEWPATGDLGDESDDVLAMRVAAAAIRGAIESRADELHVEPMRHGIYLRMRTAETLTPIIDWGLDVAGPMVEAFSKLLGLLRPATAGPARGRLDIRLDSHRVCALASAIPTLHGPSIVVRLEESRELVPELASIGLLAEQAQIVREWIRPVGSGLVLVAAAHAWDRTMAVYALVRELAEQSRKVVTVEAPVEVDLDGIVQIAAGDSFTVADALMAVMQHRPHVVACPHVRNSATLDALLDLAEGDTLVVAGVGARGPMAALGRLLDLGASPTRLSAVVRGAMALKMVPKLDPASKMPDPTADRPDYRDAFGLSPESPAALGASFTAYHGPVSGRTGVFALVSAADARLDALARGEFPRLADDADRWRVAALQRLLAGDIRLLDALRFT